jgi:NAD(P)-dependent dehydrogenase (short-subunit alcohol dehydrogenase family)
MPTHLLTGATSGIGAAVAHRLSRRGDALVLLVRDGGRAAELSERYPGARLLVADLSEPELLADTLASQDLPPALDSLVHSAGVAELGPVGELPVGAWRRTLDVNLVAPAELTRICLPSLRAGAGHVVFVNSGSGWHAGPEWGAYAASKHALRALGESLRAEERESGVRVTSIYPGRVATPMQVSVHQQEGRSYDPGAWIQPESVATAVLTALDLPRDAEVTDLSVRPGPRPT